jgi:CRP-like cAMP-binding protein
MELTNEKIVKNSFWANLFKPSSEQSEIEEVLISMPPFSNLSHKHLKTLTKIMHPRVYAPNEYVFYQNDPGICLYIVIDGEVKIIHTENNEEVVLAALGKGDFFGELALVDEARRSATAKATTETRILVIFRPDLDEFIKTYPKEGIKILKGISFILASRLRNLNQDYFTLFNKLKKS